MKIRCALVFGGRSVEHEISVISALQAAQSLDREKYDVIPVYMTKDNIFLTGPEVGNIEAYRDIKTLTSSSDPVYFIRENGRVFIKKAKHRAFSDDTVSEIDIVLPVVHGTNLEDGCLQGYFHTLGVPFAGCEVLSSAMGMDKAVMKSVLKQAGIPVLDCIEFTAADYSDPDAIINRIVSELGYPVIIKPVNLGSSVGIKKGYDEASLRDAVDLAFTFSRRILAEHSIEDLKEINCSVLGDTDSAEASECEEPLGSGEILSYTDKYMSGGKGAKTSGSKASSSGAGARSAPAGAKMSGGKSGMASLQRKIPADIDPSVRDRVRSLAVDTFKALQCSGVARIDFMLDQKDNSLYVNEINTIPGSLSFYLWEPVGLPYGDLLDRVIDLAFKRARLDEKVTYSFDTNVLENAHIGQRGK
ncbi:MAG: D-alanine--D-alanine ligase [Lachnospiraceae bacterium]|nr:D-alanine--D-alanine ligase [Lachnospiraceae bacterium]